MSTETNFCRICQQDKPLSEFYLCRGYVENRCKTCKNKTRTRNRSVCKVQGCGSQVYKFGRDPNASYHEDGWEDEDLDD